MKRGFADGALVRAEQGLRDVDAAGKKKKKKICNSVDDCDGNVMSAITLYARWTMSARFEFQCQLCLRVRVCAWGFFEAPRTVKRNISHVARTRKLW